MPANQDLYTVFYMQPKILVVNAHATELGLAYLAGQWLSILSGQLGGHSLFLWSTIRRN